MSNSTDLVGRRFGRIRVLQRLGAGGMGEVYVGEDETLGRRVALKAIRGVARMDAQAKLRFHREAKILSRLNHPNICQIYDLVTAGDVDLLVLELIDGQSLRELLDSGLDRRTKLSICRQIAEVLHLAHGRGIVHRDLKPENVMLTEDGTVKVLDFGISRLEAGVAAEGELREPPLPGLHGPPVDAEAATLDLPAEPAAADGPGEDTASWGHDGGPPPNGGTLTFDGPRDSGVASDPGSFRTALGALTGTPRYMSPEQARGEAATAASDMYSFGLLLQEVFTGQPPYDPDLPVHEVVLLALRGESRPVEGLDRDLTRLVDGLRSVAPEARPTAAQVVERLAWIEDRTRRRLRRALAAALVGAALLGGVKYTIDLRRERQVAEAARVEAEREAAISASTVEFLRGMLQSADPMRGDLSVEAGREIRVIEILDRAADQLDAGDAPSPEVEAALRDTLGTTYLRLGQMEQALEQQERAADLFERTLGAESPRTLDARHNLAVVRRARGDLEAAEELLGALLPLRRRLQGGHVAGPFMTAAMLAQVRIERGKVEGVTPLLEEARTGLGRLLGPRHAETLSATNSLAVALSNGGRTDEAEALYREVLEAQRATLGAGHPRTMNTQNNLAALLLERGEHGAAADLLEAVVAAHARDLGHRHQDTLGARTNLASARWKEGEVTEAARHFRGIHEGFDQLLGPRHPQTLVVANNLARVLVDDGELDEAESLYDWLRQSAPEVFSPQHPTLLVFRASYAALLEARGRIAEAEAELRQSLETLRETLGEEHQVTQTVAGRLAEFHERNQRP